MVDVAAQHHLQVDSLWAYFYSKKQVSPLHTAVRINQSAVFQSSEWGEVMPKAD